MVLLPTGLLIPRHTLPVNGDHPQWRPGFRSAFPSLAFAPEASLQKSDNVYPPSFALQSLFFALASAGGKKKLLERS